MRVILSAALLLGLAGGAAAQSPGDTVRLTLEDAVRRALDRGEEMRVARADQRDAQGRVTEATAAALPQVRGEVVYTRLFNTIFEDAAADSTFGPIFANTPFGAPNQWNVELRATQLLFAGGKVGAALKGARAYRRAAAEQTAETEANVIYAVKRAYLEAQFSGRLVVIAEAGLESAREHLTEVQRFQQAGTRAEYDLLRAQVEAANQEPLVIEARNRLDLATLELKRLVNLPTDASLVLVTPALAADDMVPVVATDSVGTAERPALRVAEANVAVWEQAVRVARGDRWPTLSVGTTLQHQGFPQSGSPFDARFVRNWNAEARLSVPLFLGFRTAGSVERAQASLERARSSMEQTRETVALEVARAEAELQRTSTLLAAQRATVRQAGRAHHLANVRYANGMATQIEVSDARLLLQQAEVNAARALRDYLLGIADLERALGRPVPVERRPLDRVVGTESAKGLEP